MSVCNAIPYLNALGNTFCSFIQKNTMFIHVNKPLGIENGKSKNCAKKFKVLSIEHLSERNCISIAFGKCSICSLYKFES